MNGTHYARTSEAWLSQMDRNKDEIMPILGQIYGEVRTCESYAVCCTRLCLGIGYIARICIICICRSFEQQQRRYDISK